MNIVEAMEAIQKKYPKTSEVDIQIFREWLDEFRTDNYEKIIISIIKSDNRDKYREMLPTWKEYNAFFNSDSYDAKRGSGCDMNSLEYTREKTMGWDVYKIIETCHNYRIELNNKNLSDLNRNLRIDFLSMWDVLSAEKHHAENNDGRMPPQKEVTQYLEMCKRQILDGKTWKRPYSAPSFFSINESEDRTKKIQSYGDLKLIPGGVVNESSM